MDIRYNDLPLRIINVYTPTNAEKQKKTFHQLSTLVIKDSTIVLGDFNSVHTQSDRLSNQTNTTTIILNQLLNDFQLKESKHNGAFTYQNSGDASKQSRIDYIFGPVEIMNATYLYQVWTSILDHSILVVREDHRVERGLGQWHFSKDILEDDSICKQLEAVLLEELTEDTTLQ